MYYSRRRKEVRNADSLAVVVLQDLDAAVCVHCTHTHTQTRQTLLSPRLTKNREEERGLSNSITYRGGGERGKGREKADLNFAIR